MVAIKYILVMLYRVGGCVTVGVVALKFQLISAWSGFIFLLPTSLIARVSSIWLGSADMESLMNLKFYVGRAVLPRLTREKSHSNAVSM